MSCVSYFEITYYSAIMLPSKKAHIFALYSFAKIKFQVGAYWRGVNSEVGAYSRIYGNFILNQYSLSTSYQFVNDYRWATICHEVSIVFRFVFILNHFVFMQIIHAINGLFSMCQCQYKTKKFKQIYNNQNRFKVFRLKQIQTTVLVKLSSVKTQQA